MQLNRMSYALGSALVGVVAALSTALPLAGGRRER